MPKSNVVRLRSNRNAVVSTPSFDVDSLIAELDRTGANSRSGSYDLEIDTYVNVRGRRAA